jgi:hypothetical protein
MTVESITFNDPFISGGTQVGTISSSNLMVDYGTMQAIGDITVTINPGNPGAGTYIFSGTPGSPLNVTNAGGNYTIVGGTSTPGPGFPPTTATADANGIVNIIWPNSTQAPTQVLGNYIVAGSTINIFTGQVTEGTVYQDPNLAVTSSPVCFAAGTLIRTVRGDVPVETLVVGDVVITASGEHRPIVWLGHRKFDCAGHPDPFSIWPIRIRAEAFGAGLPERDLYLSPGHSICVTCVEEVLIPAAELVNGSTISRVEVDEIDYWHVELESHDILIANGLPAESYLDVGNRIFFVDNVLVGFAAFDRAQRTHKDFCRPFINGGVILEAVRAQLISRAEALGWKRDTGPGLRLFVDGVERLPISAASPAFCSLRSRAM